MAPRITIKNGPAEMNIEECTIGSVLRWKVKLEEQTAPNVYTPIDLTVGYDLEAHLKKKPKTEELPLAEIEVVALGVPDLGWLEFELDGPVSLDIATVHGEGDYHWSFKATPTGDIEDGTTFIRGVIPLVWRAVR